MNLAVNEKNTHIDSPPCPSPFVVGVVKMQSECKTRAFLIDLQTNNSLGKNIQLNYAREKGLIW